MPESTQGVSAGSGMAQFEATLKETQERQLKLAILTADHEAVMGPLKEANTQAKKAGQLSA
ncbi:MAG: hypothetical protein ACFCUR_03985 [Rhodomicrobiaceae bacterium]